MNITPQGYETTLTRKELLEARDKDAARLRAKWKADKERKVTAMMDWETLYRRLVARLEKTAALAGTEQDSQRALDYDVVVRAHVQTAADLPVRGEGEPPSKEALLAAEGAG